MSTARFAVFVDLENAGAKVSMMNSIIDKVKIRGNILLGKVYGYTDRYSELKEVLLSNTFNAIPSLRYGHSQKNNLDIQLVIDALEVAYTNELIDSFCIVSGDSDYTPLVGKLKSMGKTVIGISRSEVASNLFINACNEFIFLESVSTAAKPAPTHAKKSANGGGDITELAELTVTILDDQENDMMYLSELKDTLMRLRPDFNERAYGCSSFGKLMVKIAAANENLRLINENSSLLMGLKTDESATSPQITRENHKDIFIAHLKRFKEEGFARINPSILKAAIKGEYPDFDERALGAKRFSDLMKMLEKDGILSIEYDEQRTMLIKIP